MKQPEPQGSGKEHVPVPDISPLLTVLNYFHPLSPRMETYLKEHVTGLSVRKRKLLLKEGNFCEHIYFVVKGAVRGFTREGQKDITTWIVVENELVSSILGLNGREISVENIQVLENSELLAMTIGDLQRMYEELPEFNLLARKLLQHY